MKLYLYSQNNSGGYFIGPQMIIVSAKTEEEADRLAKKLGVDEDAPYCECCGPRWSLYASEYDTLKDVKTRLKDYPPYQTPKHIKKISGVDRFFAALVKEKIVVTNL